MKLSYFPGCTLKNKAADLDEYARKSALALGVVLEEIEEWQCCGGVFTTANDEIATKLSSVRALAAAKEKDQPLVSVCSACHNVIKQTNFAMQNDREFADKVNRYLAPDLQYDGSTKVYHYLEMLRDIVGFDEIKKRTVKPFTGKKIAAYYGCLLLRPAKAMAMDDPENPQIMEDFIRAIGGEPVIYPYRNECCGGYITLEDAELAKKKSSMVSDSAVKAGAECIVTACPLCKYNLVKNGSDIPVIYFTELLAEALGIKEANNG